MLATASVVAKDVSAHMTTSAGNTISTEHSHLVMRVLAGGSMSARSKFAHECNVACSRYRSSIKLQLKIRAGATILQVVRLNLCHYCQTYTLE